MAAWNEVLLAVAAGAAVAAGCAADQPRPAVQSQSRMADAPDHVPPAVHPPRSAGDVERVAYEATEDVESESSAAANATPVDELNSLVSTALAANARLSQMQQEAAAAWARVRYVDELPDPEVGAMAVVPPMHFADGRQVAIVSFRQSIPWLKRLAAREQQAYFQAWALDSAWQAERLRIISDVKVAYYRLYALEQQLRINHENRQLIDLLTNVATERVAAQSATEGDVLLGTLELSRLEEQRLGLVERGATLRANINRLLNRAAETPVRVPQELSPIDPAWTLETLRQTAWSRQPDIAAAQLRSHAAAWGIRVAELERRPDVTLNLDWMVMQPQREPGLPAFGGDDSVQVGAMVDVPLWHEKYNAMRDEAVRESMASRFSLADVQRQYEAMLAELLEQARAAARTANLYNLTMLPQARQTFAADQRAYVGPGTVEFDRVIEDFRTVLTLEEGYHRAVAEWAIATARIEQAVAVEIDSLPVSPAPAPPAQQGIDERTGIEAVPGSPIRQVSAPPGDPRFGSLPSRPEPARLSTRHAGRTTSHSRRFAHGAAEFLGRERGLPARDR